jgi:hypothetical protein
VVPLLLLVLEVVPIRVLNGEGRGDS